MYELNVNVCPKDKTSLLQEPSVPVDKDGKIIHGQEPVEERGKAAPVSTPTVMLRATLRCDDPPLEIPLEHNMVIGREGTVVLDGFPNAIYLSRRHARFTNEPGGWYIQVEPDSRRASVVVNRTSVNGIDVPLGKKVMLNDGDRIVLANIHFTFKLHT
jgi:hypothetical protein